MIRRELEEGMVSGLRFRYFPKNRIGQGLISVAPWVNIVLLIFFFLILDRKQVLQPGILVELPRAPFEQGTPVGDPVAVVLTVAGEIGKATDNEFIFFEDERFRLKKEGEKRRLLHAFSKRVREHPGQGLVIQADRSISHGTIVELMNMAFSAGMSRVNLAVKPD